VRIEWTPARDDDGLLGYRLFRDGRYLRAVPKAVVRVTLALPCGRHAYRIEAVDTANQDAAARVQVRRRCP
jgi:hypothetical protein